MTKIDAVNSAMARAPYFALTPEMIRQLRDGTVAAPAPSDAKTPNTKDV